MSRFLAAVTLLVAAATLPSSPAAAQARAISPGERAQGAQADPELRQAFGGAYTGPQTAYVQRVGRRVAVQSGLSDAQDDFTVTLLDSPVENAFAIPGGYVYVTRQLLALMNSEAELASVMGHEVGHVAARHSAKRSTRSRIGGIAAAVLGQVTGSDLLGRGAGLATNLYTLGFSRAQEYEADALGVRYVAAAGYTPFAVADILQQLDAEVALGGTVSGQRTGQATWLSTHPSGAERVRRARALAVATGRPDTTGTQDTAFLHMLDGLPYDDGGKRVKVVAVGPRDTVASLAARMAYPDYRVERFAALNGFDPDVVLDPGTLVKLVVAR